MQAGKMLVTLCLFVGALFCIYLFLICSGVAVDGFGQNTNCRSSKVGRDIVPFSLLLAVPEGFTGMFLNEIENIQGVFPSIVTPWLIQN